MTPAELEERLLAVEKKVGIRPYRCICWPFDPGYTTPACEVHGTKPEPPKKGWTAREGDLVKYESSPMGGGISYSKGVEIHPQAVRVRMHWYVLGKCWAECRCDGDHIEYYQRHAYFLQISEEP